MELSWRTGYKSTTIAHRGATMNAADQIRNRNAYPREKLLQHAGKYVAWSEDGTEILADAEDIGALIDAMDARYPAGTEFLISYVPTGPYADPDPQPPPGGVPFGLAANGNAP
jgi:hypothetical protein